MLADDTLKSRILDTLAGALIFFIVVAGGTYYLQSSLILYKNYDAYTHWGVVLMGLPLIAGIIMRFSKLIYPLISAVIGAMTSAAVLYPLYNNFWAEPPTIIDLIVYVTVVLGIGYIATQPLRTTFMIAFRIGRFSVPNLNIMSSGNNKSGSKAKSKTKSVSKTKAKPKKAVRKTSMTKTQRLQANEHGSVIAMLELLIGISSLALSIFSIFFLGRS